MNIYDIKSRFENREIKIIGQDEEFKRYSVVIPLVYDDELKILLEVRSKKLKFQPGDVSLPGGKIEEGEEPKEAALREFIEETGIREEDFEYIGQFDTLVTYHGKIIYVFVVLVKNLGFTPNPEEVDELFLVPFNYFKNTNPELYYATIDAKFENEHKFNKIKPKLLTAKSPIYFYEYQNKIIWGITAKIIYNFIKEII